MEALVGILLVVAVLTIVGWLGGTVVGIFKVLSKPTKKADGLDTRWRA